MKAKAFLRKNRFKEEGDNKPSWKDSRKISDKWLDYVVAWVNTDKNGEQYISLTIDLDVLKQIVEEEKISKPQYPTLEGEKSDLDF